MTEASAPLELVAAAQEPILRADRFLRYFRLARRRSRRGVGGLPAGARLIADAPPKTRALGIDGAACSARPAQRWRMPTASTASAARAFFERHFVPHRIEARGFVTGYYEPEVEASRERDRTLFRAALSPPRRSRRGSRRRTPARLGSGDALRAPDGAGSCPFFDRAAIEAGALAGRGLELAFLDDPVDAFFIHVQGSARLRLADGGAMRIAFDGKAGHPYTSIGRLAVERGLLPATRRTRMGWKPG